MAAGGDRMWPSGRTNTLRPPAGSRSSTRNRKPARGPANRPRISASWGSLLERPRCGAPFPRGPSGAAGAIGQTQEPFRPRRRRERPVIPSIVLVYPMEVSAVRGWQAQKITRFRTTSTTGEPSAAGIPEQGTSVFIRAVAPRTGPSARASSERSCHCVSPRSKNTSRRGTIPPAPPGQAGLPTP
jgi:hypothetical protein